MDLDAQPVGGTRPQSHQPIVFETGGLQDFFLTLYRGCPRPEPDAALVSGLYEKAVRGFCRTLLEPEWRVSKGGAQRNRPIIGAQPG